MTTRAIHVLVVAASFSHYSEGIEVSCRLFIKSCWYAIIFSPEGWRFVLMLKESMSWSATWAERGQREHEQWGIPLCRKLVYANMILALLGTSDNSTIHCVED